MTIRAAYIDTDVLEGLNISTQAAVCLVALCSPRDTPARVAGTVTSRACGPATYTISLSWPAWCVSQATIHLISVNTVPNLHPEINWSRITRVHNISQSLGNIMDFNENYNLHRENAWASLFGASKLCPTLVGVCAASCCVTLLFYLLVIIGVIQSDRELVLDMPNAFDLQPHRRQAHPPLVQQRHWQVLNSETQPQPTTAMLATKGHPLREEDADCVICYESLLAIRHTVTHDSCFHSFHRTCVEKWIRRMEPNHPTCPLCNVIFNRQLPKTTPMRTRRKQIEIADIDEIIEKQVDILAETDKVIEKTNEWGTRGRVRTNIHYNLRQQRRAE